MRLNRNSLLFIALLAVVIVVALIFQNTGNDGADTTDNVEATSAIVPLFPQISDASNIVSITLTEISEVGDTRPTPIPGNPTLVPPTELPDDVEPATTTEVVSLVKDADLGTWSLGAETTQTVTGAIDSTQLETSLRSLSTLRSNRQFTPDNGDYAQYGLDQPQYDLTFVEQPVAETGGVDAADTTPTTPADPITYRLRVGNRTVGENSYYVFLNDDSETVYVVTGASALQSGILNLTTTVPQVPTPTPTIAPVLNTQAPFSDFVLTQAQSFTFTNNDNNTVIEVARSVDNTAWIYTENGVEVDVQQESLQITLNSLSGVRGVEQVDIIDLTTVGLDTPTYIFEARTTDKTFTLQLGDQDPTGTLYYGLVNDFTSVVLINASSVAILLDIFENPPLPPTPEATVEATAEATESVEMTAEPEATSETTEDVEMTAEPEVTPEATAEATESTD